MSVLQVRDIDDDLYDELKMLAKKERRSISQEVILIIESYINDLKLKKKTVTSTNKFLNLSWKGDESAEEIIINLKKQRNNDSCRFENQNDIFN